MMKLNALRRVVWGLWSHKFSGPSQTVVLLVLAALGVVSPESICKNSMLTSDSITVEQLLKEVE